MVDSSDKIPIRELNEMAINTSVQIALNMFLGNNHTKIFKYPEAKRMDYAIASIAHDNIKSFLIEWKKCEEMEGMRLPEPELTFLKRKEDVSEALQVNPYSAVTWRYSPSLIWQL